jgi:hypothetical protein
MDARAPWRQMDTPPERAAFKKIDSELDPEAEEGRIACGDLKLRRFALGMTSLNGRGERKNSLYAVPLCADKV